MQEKKTLNINHSKINERLVLSSFIYSLIGFFALIIAFFLWFFLSKNDYLISVFNYVLIAVTIAVCYITPILDICVIAKNKTSSWIFLVITIILNFIAPLIFIFSFILFCFFIQESDDGLISYGLFALISQILILIAAFTQVISNLVIYLETRKGVNLLQTKKVKNIKNSKEGN